MKRKRIKRIKTEKVSSSSYALRKQLQRAAAAGVELPSKIRKDSSNLPNELPDHIKGGLIFDI